MPETHARRLAVPAGILACYAMLYAVYESDHERLYLSLMKWLGHADVFPVPFIDAAAVLSWMDCTRAGIDVLVRNPCDPLGRGLAYSPIWLWLHHLPIGIADTNALGFLQFAILLAALYALPAPASWGEVALRVACGMSSSVIFAVERANPDLIIFGLLSAASVVLARTPGRRLVGYGLILFAAMLKFYPFVALVACVREPRARMLAVCAAALSVLVAFVAIYHAQILQIAPHMPTAHPFKDFSGARLLLDGMALLWPSLPGSTGSGRIVVLLGCIVLSLAAATWLSLQVRFPAAIDRLPVDRLIALTIGAATIAGCFYAGPSVPYRGVHFLLVLPGLYTLATRSDDRAAGWLFGGTLACALLALWSGLLLELAGFSSARDAGAARVTIWLFRQLAWWALVTVLAAVVADQILRSPFTARIAPRLALGRA